MIEKTGVQFSLGAQMKKQIHNPLELDELEKEDKNDNQAIKIEICKEWPTKKDDDLPNILYRRKHGVIIEV